jgi:GNAT superfamily N-acetyltransferase
MALTIRILQTEDGQVLDHVAEGLFDNVVDDTLKAEFLHDPRHHLAVAIEDGLMIGFASAVHYVHPDKEPQLWINEVSVAAPYQGRGIGKAVLNALLQKGRELGCSEAWVLTDKENLPARALYASAAGVETEHVMVSFWL